MSRATQQRPRADVSAEVFWGLPDHDRAVFEAVVRRHHRGMGPPTLDDLNGDCGNVLVAASVHALAHKVPSLVTVGATDRVELTPHGRMVGDRVGAFVAPLPGVDLEKQIKARRLRRWFAGLTFVWKSAIIVATIVPVAVPVYVFANSYMEGTPAPSSTVLGLSPLPQPPRTSRPGPGRKANVGGDPLPACGGDAVSLASQALVVGGEVVGRAELFTSRHCDSGWFVVTSGARALDATLHVVVLNEGHRARTTPVQLTADVVGSATSPLVSTLGACVGFELQLTLSTGEKSNVVTLPCQEPAASPAPAARRAGARRATRSGARSCARLPRATACTATAPGRAVRQPAVSFHPVVPRVSDQQAVVRLEQPVATAR